MVQLIWDKIDERTYESGVSHGVLYPETTPGVVWNGLKSVAELYEGGDVESFYHEGVKYLDFVNAKLFKAQITAFSAPSQFNACLGELLLTPGVYVTGQPRARFGLSYRTRVNDSDYKIHVLYNCTATPTSRNYKTRASSISPTELQWKIDAVPIQATNHKPTAHYVIDSRSVTAESLAIFEEIMYGSESSEPRLPTPEELGSLFPVMEEFLIDLYPDFGYGFLTSDPDGDIAETFVSGLYRIIPTGRLVETVDDGFYTLEV